jgi:acetyltransferase
MSSYNLDLLFKPRSVAVIGASDKPGSIGEAILRNLERGGFAGRIIPIHPTYHRLGGLEVRKSVSDIDEPVDLALIATPIATVPELVGLCGKAGIGAAVVISSGGKETGAQGQKIEAQIKAQADLHKVRIVGPNCLGIMVPGRHVNASFAADMPMGGKLAFVSQSGAICTAILDLAFKERIGFSHFVSLGSMMDVDFGDMIDYLGHRSDAGSILLYIESLTNVRKFMSATRAVSQTKPIIALKAGRSAAGALAAASHTGALAGEDAVYDAAFKRAGIIRVDSIQDLFDCAELIAKQPLPRGAKLGIVSNGGGPGVMAADAMAARGAEPEPLGAETCHGLDQLLPAFWSRGNPIDILGDATAQRYADTIATCLASKNFDGLLVMFVPQAIAKPEAVAEAMVAAKAAHKTVPVIACWMGGRDVEPGIERLNQAGIPTYDTPERAVRAFQYLVQYVNNLELLKQVPPRLPVPLNCHTQQARQLVAAHLTDHGRFLTEVVSKAILETYGLRVTKTRMAATAQEALRLSDEFGFPLAMKIVSPDIPHKTEVNGIRLDIRSKEEAASAFDEIVTNARRCRPDALVEGVALQPFVAGADFELLLGAKRDASFGPVLVFGLGGIFTEVVKDRSIGLPPLNRLLARRLMQETRAYKLLAGYRNRPGADMALLEEMLVRLAQLLTDVPEITEADLNPVIVKNGIPMAVDARIALAPSPLPAPLHLVISPYPAQYEQRATTKTGLDIFIRPIRPEDGPLFVELFNQLSAASIYYRFCRCVKVLSPEMLFRLTQIDYDREMALVAMEGEAEHERMLGAARIINEPDGKSAEFAVLVSDPWHGQGIGAQLLEKLVHIGRERGLETIWGYVLPDNTTMLHLGRKVGFSSTYDTDVEMNVLTIDLRMANLP